MTTTNGEAPIASVSGLIKTLGVTGTIAVFLVWMLANDNRANTARLTAMEQQQARLTDLVGATYMTAERTLWVLQSMCVNAAENAGERGRCLSTPPSQQGQQP